MYSLVWMLRDRTAVTREAMTFAVSLGIAELFYKFHSFSLECLAFLATWALLSGLTHLVGRVLGQSASRAEGPE